MADMVSKELDRLDKDVEETKADLKAATEKLVQNRDNTTLQDERDRLVSRLKLLDATRQDTLRGWCWVGLRARSLQLLGCPSSGMVPIDPTTCSCGGRPGQCGCPRSW